MKHLLLLRHAKSGWDDPSLDDFDRPLAPRGIESARAIGKEIAARGWLPDKVLVSSAVRTYETWRLVSANWPGGTVHAEFAGMLYHAPAEALLSHAQKTAETVGTMLIVGHNPGMEEFALNLASSTSDRAALEAVRQKFPTGALARFTFDGGWQTLSFATATLTDFVRPRELS